MYCLDSRSQETKFCLVCDITTKINYHFGTTTCLACASFFRRTVSLGIQYICNKDGNCSASHVVRSGCRACRFKKCELAGMKAGLVRGKRDVSKMPKYVRESVQQGNDTIIRDYTTLTVETLRGCSSKPEEIENSPTEEEKGINFLLNVTSEQLMQYYIELNKKSFYPLSKIDFNSFFELNRTNNQEATLICQNCPGTDLLDLMDMGTLFRYVAFANLWLDGLWADIQLMQWMNKVEKFDHITLEEEHDEKKTNCIDTFVFNFKENVEKSLKHLNLDIVEYSALKSFCIWKLGILDFGTTLKIFAQEHYLEVTTALTEYYKTKKCMNQVESALRIANMTLLLGPIFNSYQEIIKLHENLKKIIEYEDISMMDY